MLFELVQSALPESPKLPKMSIFLMFFLNLRIGFRFGVHPSTVSRNFHHVLDVMFVNTAPLIKQPDRETLRLTMPISFRKFFRKCCVIIDCMEGASFRFISTGTSMVQLQTSFSYQVPDRHYTAGIHFICVQLYTRENV